MNNTVVITELKRMNQYMSHIAKGFDSWEKADQEQHDVRLKVLEHNLVRIVNLLESIYDEMNGSGL